MRPILACCLSVFMLLAGSAAAGAQSRYDPTRMSCADLKSTIRQEGTVTLRWSSTRVAGLWLEGRYVANRAYCGGSRPTQQSPVPTRDRASCGVNVCGPSD